jgi:hypothetical protein
MEYTEAKNFNKGFRYGLLTGIIIIIRIIIILS